MKCFVTRWQPLLTGPLAPLEDAPESFAGFDGAGKTPGQILAHMGDLFDWALSMAKGNQRWQNSAPLGWEAEKARFFAALKAFDSYLRRARRCTRPLSGSFRGRWPMR